MKNSELLTLVNGLNQCGNLQGIEFSYAIVKNAKKLQSEAEVIQGEIKKLQLENCKKDEEGKPIIVDNKYEMEDPEAFEEKYKKLMDIEVVVELHKIKKEVLPLNISAQQLAGIMDILEE